MTAAGTNNVQYFNFLSASDNHDLLEHAIDIEERFRSSSVLSYSDKYIDWRRSKDVSRKDLGQYHGVLKEAITLRYPEICDILKMEQLNEYKFEIHLTAHGDGDYFKAHYDSGTKETDNRVITFVYYFNREPKKYAGGELILHGTEKITVEPVNNMIVFFDPMCRHEVLTVRAEDRAFENSRFSLNGWILKKE